MSIRLTSATRTAVLSVGITLIASSIAWAQTPASARSIGPAAQADTSNMTFARQLAGRSVWAAPVVSVGTVSNAPLLRQLRKTTSASVASAASAHRFPAIPTRTSQRSWVSRHKALTAVIIGAGALVGLTVIAYGLGKYD